MFPVLTLLLKNHDDVSLSALEFMACNAISIVDGNHSPRQYNALVPFCLPERLGIVPELCKITVAIQYELISLLQLVDDSLLAVEDAFLPVILQDDDTVPDDGLARWPPEPFPHFFID